jgi:hypothetical protein
MTLKDRVGVNGVVFETTNPSVQLMVLPVKQHLT